MSLCESERYSLPTTPLTHVVQHADFSEVGHTLIGKGRVMHRHAISTKGIKCTIEKNTPSL